jgi:hypothetical protein
VDKSRVSPTPSSPGDCDLGCFGRYQLPQSASSAFDALGMRNVEMNVEGDDVTVEYERGDGRRFRATRGLRADQGRVLQVVLRHQAERDEPVPRRMPRWYFSRIAPEVVVQDRSVWHGAVRTFAPPRGKVSTRRRAPG